MIAKNKNLQPVKDYFANLDIDNVQAAYLFGPHTTGKANQLSDLDLVILNNLSIVAKYEVVRHNNLLYAAENFEANSYFSLTI